MSITVAKSAGFCFGVDRAVQMVYHLVGEGKKVLFLGADYPQSPDDHRIGSKRGNNAALGGGLAS